MRAPTTAPGSTSSPRPFPSSCSESPTPRSRPSASTTGTPLIAPPWDPTEKGLHVSYALHTGEVLAASIASPERLSYALVGDPVNLASRIQDLTKEVGAEVIVSGETVRRLHDPVALEALPAVRVKGRSAEVEVYRAA